MLACLTSAVRGAKGAEPLGALAENSEDEAAYWGPRTAHRMRFVAAASLAKRLHAASRGDSGQCDAAAGLSGVAARRFAAARAALGRDKQQCSLQPRLRWLPRVCGWVQRPLYCCGRVRDHISRVRLGDVRQQRL